MCKRKKCKTKNGAIECILRSIVYNFCPSKEQIEKDSTINKYGILGGGFYETWHWERDKIERASKADLLMLIHLVAPEQVYD